MKPYKKLFKEKEFKGDDDYDFDDPDAMRELELYIENNSTLYKQSFIPFIQNIKRKIKSGKYDHKLAPKLWIYYVENGAKKYAKENLSPTEKWNDIFTKKDRLILAQKLADYYFDQIQAGEY